MTATTVVSLLDLARRINEEHAAVGLAVGKMLGCARRAGDLLLEAKSHIPHGGWTAWLAENFDGSTRTAQAYMRVARHWSEIEAKAQDSADLSLDGALRMLAEPRDEEPEPDPKAELWKSEDARVNPLPGAEPASKEAAATPKRREPSPEPPPPAPDVPPEFADYNPEDDAPDPQAEWERAEKEVERLEAVVESLQSGDLEREVAAWSAKYAQLDGRVMQLTTECNEAKRTAKYATGMLAKIRKALGVERNGDILPAIEALRR